MRFISCIDGQFSFRLSPHEKRVLFQLLSLYPLVPKGYHELSRGQEREEDQQLLEEALDERRQENKQQVLALVEGKTKALPGKPGVLLELNGEELESLLQVLNDIRVGGWLALGSPDGPGELKAAINENTSSFYWAMETAGHFQMVLLEAVGSGE